MVKDAVLLTAVYIGGCSFPFFVPEDGYQSLWLMTAVGRQTYGYLPGRRSLQFHRSLVGTHFPSRGG